MAMRQRFRMAAGRVPEKVVQEQIIKLLKSIGAFVNVIGHPPPRDGRRHFGTGQTAGLPDLYAFLPLKADRDSLGAALWVEAKAADGELRAEQDAFRTRCRERSIPHVYGDLNAVIAWLMEHEYLKRDGVAHYRRPPL